VNIGSKLSEKIPVVSMNENNFLPPPALASLFLTPVDAVEVSERDYNILKSSASSGLDEVPCSIIKFL
jgi:hypothetical protein